MQHFLFQNKLFASFLEKTSSQSLACNVKFLFYFLIVLSVTMKCISEESDFARSHR